MWDQAGDELIDVIPPTLSMVRAVDFSIEQSSVLDYDPLTFCTEPGRQAWLWVHGQVLRCCQHGNGEINAQVYVESWAAGVSLSKDGRQSYIASTTRRAKLPWST